MHIDQFHQLPSLQEYLEKVGVLDGTPEEIALAKREYRRVYKRLHKRNKRQQERKIEVWVNQEEWDKLVLAAHLHQLSAVRMLKKAGLAYIDQDYLVPGRKEVGQLELMLSRIFDGIQKLSDQPGGDRTRLLDMQRSITELESLVSQSFRAPQLLEQALRQAALDENRRTYLVSILTHPHIP